MWTLGGSGSEGTGVGGGEPGDPRVIVGTFFIWSTYSFRMMGDLRYHISRPRTRRFRSQCMPKTLALLQLLESPELCLSGLTSSHCTNVGAVYAHVRKAWCKCCSRFFWCPVSQPSFRFVDCAVSFCQSTFKLTSPVCVCVCVSSVCLSTFKFVRWCVLMSVCQSTVMLTSLDGVCVLMSDFVRWCLRVLMSVCQSSVMLTSSDGVCFDVRLSVNCQVDFVRW